MSAVGMQGMIEQMRAMAVQAGAAPVDRGGGTGTAGFGEALQASLERINHVQQAAGQEARAFQVGTPGVALYDVVIDQQKASLAFQAGVQVRNRVVSAYQRIMHMQV